MKIVYEIIRGILIGFASYQVLWLIFCYLHPKPKPNSSFDITMAGFTITYFEFVIPVAVIAMATRKRFPINKPWLYDIYEGLTISAIYVAVIFAPDILNLIIGWVAGESWGDRYFNWLPTIEPMTIFSFLAIPLVVLCIRNLIEKPFFKRLEERLDID